MATENISKKLEKYDFNFVNQEKSIIIKAGLSQEVEVWFHENGKIMIKDKLTGWNPLTGLIQMSLRSAVIYISIAFFALLAVMIFTSSVNDNITPFFGILYTLLTVWSVMWVIYYTIKLESLKRTLIFFIENE